MCLTPACHQACPDDAEDSCVPGSIWGLIFLGVGLLGLSGVALFGIFFQKKFMVRTVTIVMTLTSVVLLLSALFLGISSGAIMDDMSYYYDANYPKLRQALEAADAAANSDTQLPSYCQMKKEDCELLTYDVAGTAGVYPQKCTDNDNSGDYNGDECESIITTEDSAAGADYKMTAADIWKDQYAIAARYSADAEQYPWLEPCKTTGICIYCDEFFRNVETTPAGYTSSAPPVSATCKETASVSVPADKGACAAVTDLDTADACEAVVAAAGGGQQACTYRGAMADCVFTRDSGEEADAGLCAAVKDSTALADPGACDAVKTSVAVCTADDGGNSCDSYDSSADCANVEGCSWSGGCSYVTRSQYLLAANLDWIDALAGERGDTLVTNADGKLKNYDAAEVAAGTICVPSAGVGASVEDASACAAVDALDDSTACDAAAADCTYVTGRSAASVDEWTSAIANFTNIHSGSRFAMPNCRQAVSDYTTDVTTCPAETPEDVVGTYAEDCKIQTSTVLSRFASSIC